MIQIESNRTELHVHLCPHSPLSSCYSPLPQAATPLHSADRSLHMSLRTHFTAQRAAREWHYRESPTAARSTLEMHWESEVWGFSASDRPKCLLILGGVGIGMFLSFLLSLAYIWLVACCSFRLLFLFCPWLDPNATNPSIY